jgi:DNA-binding response OmpR family regulator
VNSDGKTTPRIESQKTGKSDAPSRSILVVDDDPSLLTMIRILLITSGFGVEIARNGADALEKTRATGFDLVLLDLEMPVMDGREFFRMFRAENQSTPVLILSAHGAFEAREELRAEGAMAKPFDPFALVREVEAWLNPDVERATV